MLNVQAKPATGLERARKREGARERDTLSACADKEQGAESLATLGIWHSLRMAIIIATVARLTLCGQAARARKHD